MQRASRYDDPFRIYARVMHVCGEEGGGATLTLNFWGREDPESAGLSLSQKMIDLPTEASLAVEQVLFLSESLTFPRHANIDKLKAIHTI